MRIIEEFGINPYLLVAQIVNFAILLFLLKKFLYKPILKVLDERKAKIARSLKEAEEIEKRLSETRIQQEKILEKAKTEAANIVAEAKSESKKLSEKILADAKIMAEEMLAKTQKTMDLEKEKMLTEVKKDLADLVIEATEAVAKKSMREQDNTRLVEETVKEIIR